MDMKAQNNQVEQNRPVQNDFSKAIGTALSVMKALAVVLDRETDALNKREETAMPAIRQEKARLIRDYRSSLALLIHNPERLKEAPEESRQQLRKIGEVLAVATKRNVDTLRTAVTATQALVLTIVNAARDQAKSTDTYVDHRRLGASAASYASLCSPVAVNRTA